MRITKVEFTKDWSDQKLGNILEWDGIGYKVPNTAGVTTVFTPKLVLFFINDGTLKIVETDTKIEE